ncbi:FMN-linked alkanal monooxygenase [Pseudoclavibacter endophyticus]|uniref:LLM class flavin-dependent oxidoreductase n=2 Tax=Pseudoclavibacter endophyticus TaxID=1778590 RepID=A0A6H9WUT7_9MICO|nr:LLM class flavin-dependent oxidoreductase [Pseudoclavibacter endophyticus]GGA66367.1 FMN-linked alkanal monooxygenase [Pseudoclavibacter endophyticus]
MTPVPFSVLDLAILNANDDVHSALAATLELARVADGLGYRRFWVAEHHNGESIASTSPPVLLGAIGAATTSIRIGSGGVMLPNHVPYVVAEQFALLDGLYPDRVDLGVGRAPGTDPFTAAALRRDQSRQAVDDFPSDVIELLGFFGDVREFHDPDTLKRLRVAPESETHPRVWMLGSSRYGAELAGKLGLPYAFANHFGMASDPRAAADHYRKHFEPSPLLAEPYLMMSASAVTAESREAAQRLSLPAKVMMHQIRLGRVTKVMSPEDAAVYRERVVDREVFEASPGIQYAGTAEVVLSGLEALAAETGADEIMLAGTIYDPADRVRMLRELAALRAPVPEGARDEREPVAA